MSFEAVQQFEDKIAGYFGSKYAVAVDSCTHGLELCLRYKKVDKLVVPKRTYISVPFLANKLGIPLEWKDESWNNFYELGDTKIFDAAVLWGYNTYKAGTMMCISFQYRKHLSLGRGGMILLDDENCAKKLKKMSYDGRVPNIPWREQNINSFGYHYYMTPETAKLGLQKLPQAIEDKPKKWLVTDWPDLTEMEIFND
tara:strand:+ start:4119 stop:4712 length:594 start_codon:yes stop_codon:yes gene_type:complete